MRTIPSDTASGRITIRPAEPADADRIVAFQLALARESESLELDPPTVRQGVAAVFEHPERGEYWIAEVASEMAGCLLTLDEWSDWRNGTVLWIHSVYVAPAFRRRGVFRAMYAFLQTRVIENDTLHGLRLFVDQENLSAQRAYADLGMTDDHYRLFEWLKTP